MKHNFLLPICAVSAISLAACTTDDTSSPAPDAGPANADAGSSAGDAAVPDAPDAGTVPDAAASADAGPSDVIDAAMPDAAASDAAVTDASMPDAATSDAAVTDAAVSDAGAVDAAVSDAALSDASSSSDVPDGGELLDASTELGDAASDAASPIVDLGSKALLDLTDVKTNPDAYTWFDFRPNVKKLILAGAPETEHIAILWYTVTDGAVGLHYHSKTECVYVIDGTQTDAKGVYPTGTVYYNPPTSGHAVSDSSGFFLLSYAAPPDFTSTDLIAEYTPIRIDTEDPELLTEYAFDSDAGVSTYAVPLEGEGGMSSELIALGGDEEYTFSGNYVLVLEGSCEIDGTTLGEDSLVVTELVEPESFSVAASEAADCLALGISF